MSLVQPLADGQRLGQHGTIVRLQRRNQALWVEPNVLLRPLPAMAQMVEDVLDRNAFQIERDAHTPSRSGPEVAMQAHCRGLHLIRHSGDRADSGVLSGWCDPLTGFGHRLAEHRGIADMVRQQKNQLGVDEPALLRREVAMDVDQGFVEAVRSAIFRSVFSMASS